MKILLTAILLFFGIVNTVSAQDRAFVRAGEHATYSRLVVQVLPDQIWEFRTSGRKATLLFNETSTDFDIEEVYDRIPRTRILSLSSEKTNNGTALTMTLGCDCKAAAQLESGMLVIDVFDASTDTESNIDAVEIEDENLSASTAPVPRPQFPDITPTPTVSGDQANLSDIDDAVETEQPEFTVQSEVAADEVTTRLLSQLNKAAEQGLIQLAETDTAPPELSVSESLIDSSEALETEPFLDRVVQDIDGLEAMADQLKRELENEDLGLSITVEVPQTQSIKPGSARTPELQREVATDLAENEHCIDPDLLNISDWSDDRSAAVQISELRGKVFGEFDRADPTTALDLVRLYIAHGLGIEAQAMIADLALSGHEAEILGELALIIEGMPHVPAGLLDKAAGCGGNNDMWRTAALADSENIPLPDPDSVVEYFSQMPILVRRIVGPSLIDSLLTRGQSSFARQIFSIIDRSPGEDTEAIRLARSKLDHEDGQILEAEGGYASIVHSGGTESVQAAVLLTDSILSRGADPPELLIQDLEALAYLYRGTDQGLDLRVAEIKAKAGSEQLKDALDVVDRELNSTDNRHPDILSAANKILASATSGRYGPGEIAVAVFEYDNIVLDPLITPETRLHLAEEILSLGLPKMALGILKTDENAPAAGHELVAAQASLSMGLIDTTIELLDRNTLPAAAYIRAKAFTYSGQFDEALTEILQTPAIAETPEFAWRAGNWDLAMKSNREEIRSFAEFMIGRERAPKPSSSVLAEIGIEDQTDNILNPPPQERANLSLTGAIEAAERSASIRSYLADALSRF